MGLHIRFSLPSSAVRQAVGAGIGEEVDRGHVPGAAIERAADVQGAGQRYTRGGLRQHLRHTERHRGLRAHIPGGKLRVRPGRAARVPGTLWRPLSSSFATTPAPLPPAPRPVPEPPPPRPPLPPSPLTPSSPSHAPVSSGSSPPKRPPPQATSQKPPPASPPQKPPPRSPSQDPPPKKPLPRAPPRQAASQSPPSKLPPPRSPPPKSPPPRQPRPRSEQSMRMGYCTVIGLYCSGLDWT